MVKAIKCGRCDTIATTLSCVSASIRSTIEPRRRQSSAIRSTAAASPPGTGVMMT
jgi:hypothetical protein